MNFAEFVSLFDTLTDMYQTPYWQEQEKRNFFNLAINSFVNNHYDDYKRKVSVDAFFEANQRLTDSLGTLVTTALVVSGTFITANVTNTHGHLTFIIPRPADYRFFIMCELTMNNKAVYPREYTWHELKNIFQDAYNNPIPSDPVIVVHGQGLLVFSDNEIATNAKVTYIKEPLQFSVSQTTIDLPEATHKEICCMAYMIANYPSDELQKIQLSELLNKVCSDSIY